MIHTGACKTDAVEKKCCKSGQFALNEDTRVKLLCVKEGRRHDYGRAVRPVV
jgi:hypothetical protein